ncbi:hypothetical protein BD324DRAFT_471241 [Kockovaella imperatae]|uniref:Uncharacterized protein n=1 Tax=Kockovaella imperatae TaxID=4999 RepID=A0A1Y1UH62_9TREE|nr:hypothetical protein BD324DRAFT_471241 [Kockovaella imperatae]ORX36824.1 hypothetical protein BD324DRAFT_471241 [Kockovaella imperatae]
MSDLTPPASKHNTPQRVIPPESSSDLNVAGPSSSHLGVEAPASPTSMREDSAALELDAEDNTPRHGEDPAEKREQHTGSSGMEVDAENLTESATDRDEDEEVERYPGDHEAAAREVLSDGASPGKADAKSGTVDKGKGKKVGRGSGKDGDLYESDIVERWNQEFGDVLLNVPGANKP